MEAKVLRTNFDINSDNYVNSDIHRNGKDLLDLSLAVSGMNEALALDLGSGAGHTTFAIAPSVKWVISADISDSMLKNVTIGAKERALTNILTRNVSAENLTFESNSFDLVVSRFSMHHWEEPVKSLNEVCRILKNSGTFILIDIVSPESDTCETWLNSIELLRDYSHVKDRKSSKLCELLISSNFEIEKIESYSYSVDFNDWVTRSNTPKQSVLGIKYLMDIASDRIKNEFAITKDYNFNLKYNFILAKKI